MHYDLSSLHLYEPFFYHNFFPKKRNETHFQRYIKFINSRKLRKINKLDQKEIHHILPSSLCPESWSKKQRDHPDNLIILSLREHFIAHLILWKAFGDKMTYVFNMMTNYFRLSWNSKIFETLKIEAKIQNKKFLEEYYSIEENKKQRGSHIRGKTLEEFFGEEKALEIRKKYKENHADMTGENNPFYNQNHSEETKKFLSNFRTGKTWEEILGEDLAKELKEKASYREKNLMEKGVHPFQHLDSPHPNFGKVLIFSSNEKKFVLKEEVDFYLKEGWEVSPCSTYLKKEYSEEEKRKHYRIAANNRPKKECPICGKIFANPVFSSHYKACERDYSGYIDWNKLESQQKVMVTKNNKSTWVSPLEAKELLNEGYSLGRRKIKPVKTYDCPCCEHKNLNSGAFSRHMLAKHNWSKNDCKNYRNKN